METTPPIALPTPAAKPPLSLNLILIVITLASLLLTGFFIYQNRLLQQRLAAIESSQIPTPVEPTSTPVDETANWKMHNNKSFNFSIKYPTKWTAACQNPTNSWSSATICDLRAPNTIMDHGQLSSGANVTVGVEKPNPNYNTLDKKVAFDTKNYGYQSIPYSINNIAGFLYTSPNNNAFVTQNGSNFIIVSWIPLADANQYKQTVDQILSTFKFL